MANKKYKSYSLQPKVEKEKFFDHLENMVEEKALIYGRPAFFIRQTEIEVDNILIEVTSKKFQFQHMTQIFFIADEDSEDMDGGMVYGGFNMIPLYSKIIHVPVSFFTKIDYTPKSGDLIYLPENNQEEMLFEIIKDPVREQDRSNTKNGRKFAYKLFLKLYSNDRGNVDFEGTKEDIDNSLDFSDEDMTALEELANALEDITSPIEDKLKTQKDRKEEINKTQTFKTEKGRFEDL